MDTETKDLLAEISQHLLNIVIQLTKANEIQEKTQLCLELAYKHGWEPRNDT